MAFFKPAAPTSSFGGFGAATTTPTQAPATTSFGGFGQNQQQQQQPQQQTSSLFGAKPAGSTFGGGTSSLFGQQGQQQQGQQPAAGGGLFGSAQNQNQNQPGTSSTGLFGASQPQQQQQPGGGLFASLGAPKPAAPSGGGLFGQTQQQPQQQQSTAGSSLFGAKPGGLFGAQSQSTPQQGGLFGQTQAQPQQQGGLFGQSQSQPQQQGGGLFGQQPQSQPQQQGGLFGQTQAQPQQQGGLFGQSQAQPQQQQSLFGKPQQSLLQSNAAPKSTKFSDLPENAQKMIEQMDVWIKDQKQIGASIRTDQIEMAIWQTSGDVKAASDEQAAISEGLASLKSTLEHLASRAQSGAEDLQKLLETWEASKPVDARHTLRPIAHRDFPQEFFGRVAVELEDRVNRYKRNIALLARAVTSLANDHEKLSPQVVVQTIKNNETSIIALAGQLEELQLRLNAARAEFIEEYRESTNSMRDPFQVAREAKGLSLLRA